MILSYRNVTQLVIGTCRCIILLPKYKTRLWGLTGRPVRIVVTQCAAVTICRFDISVPPQMYFKSALSKRYMAACQGQSPSKVGSPWVIRGWAVMVDIPHCSSNSTTAGLLKMIGLCDLSKSPPKKSSGFSVWDWYVDGLTLVVGVLKQKTAE